jgi:hypothetical protein
MDILTWLGGYTAILASILYGLFKWKGDIWAKRIAQREQHELNKRLKYLESNTAPKTHVHKIQFEMEYKHYSKIWTDLTSLNHQMQYCRQELESGNFIEASINETAYSKAANSIQHAVPFIDSDIYGIALNAVNSIQAIVNNYSIYEKSGYKLIKPVISVEALELKMIDLHRAIRSRCSEMVLID